MLCDLAEGPFQGGAQVFSQQRAAGFADRRQSLEGPFLGAVLPQFAQVAVQCAQREACDVLASEADCSGASLLAGLGDGDQQVERGADRFGQGEGRKIQGLHEAAVDAHASLLPALEFGLYGL